MARAFVLAIREEQCVARAFVLAPGTGEQAVGQEREFDRRRLPHLVPAGATVFVTFRLAGSIPNEVLARWAEEERGQAASLAGNAESWRRAWRQRFREVEACLDRAVAGPRWLERPDVAGIVVGAFDWIADRKADVEVYCVMPNHVHALLTPRGLEGADGMASILRSLKGYTAWEANRLLGRSGPFWQHESYDHYLRNERERERIADYILWNPVRAGLVEEPGGWPWRWPR